MDVTGQIFDMDPKTFTLGSMFAMQVWESAIVVAPCSTCQCSFGCLAAWHEGMGGWGWGQIKCGSMRT